VKGVLNVDKGFLLFLQRVARIINFIKAWTSIKLHYYSNERIFYYNLN
jgi:hypothetical protein